MMKKERERETKPKKIFKVNGMKDRKMDGNKISW